MVQKTLEGKDITELDRLYTLRMEYYNEMCRDIEDYKIRVKAKVIDYRNVIKELDLQIEKEKRKSRKLDLENKNGERKNKEKQTSNVF
jgi:hypothetical protein